MSIYGQCSAEFESKRFCGLPLHHAGPHATVTTGRSPPSLDEIQAAAFSEADREADMARIVAERKAAADWFRDAAAVVETAGIAALILRGAPPFVVEIARRIAFSAVAEVAGKIQGEAPSSDLRASKSVPLPLEPRD